MDITSKWSYYLCFTITAVLGFPHLRKQSNSIVEVTQFCDSRALKSIMEDYKLPVLDFLSDMRSENSGTVGNEYLKTFSDEAIQELNNGILKSDMLRQGRLHGIKSQLMEKDNYQKILTEFSRIRKECLLRFISDAAPDAEGKRNSDISDLLNTDIFTSDDLKELLGGRNTGTATVKRAKLGLNPTGWRKRRSESQEQERLQQYLANMRQLLEKRQRLEFNPTGW